MSIAKTLFRALLSASLLMPMVPVFASSPTSGCMPRAEARIEPLPLPTLAEDDGRALAALPPMDILPLPTLETNDDASPPRAPVEVPILALDDLSGEAPGEGALMPLEALAPVSSMSPMPLDDCP